MTREQYAKKYVDLKVSQGLPDELKTVAFHAFLKGFEEGYNYRSNELKNYKKK